ncbi:MAG: cytochrome c peroxidase [Bacteroidota bacterium]
MGTLRFCLQFGALAVFFAFLGRQFITEDIASNDLTSSLEATASEFRTNLDALAKEIESYYELAHNNAGSTELREQHSATRIAFKKVEYLLEFIDPQAVKRFINGAPLPKIEPGVPEIVVIKPSGLQTLDEIVYADEIDREAVRQLTAKLKKKYAEIHAFARIQRLQHRFVFEGMRLELVRIFTLGVTGFDTPASGTALPENMATLQVLANTYQRYARFVAEKDEQIDETIKEAFQRGVAQFQNGDFDTFDRLTFLREVINPLTKNLTAAQNILAIEFSSENLDQPIPLNYRAEQLFDEEWFRPEYYAGLSKANFVDQRIDLGRLLFFDPILSGSNERACASCHHPSKAFTDGETRSLASEGSGYETILRNSPTLVNCVYTEKFFYDLREDFLERQIRHVVQDSLEFGTDFITVLEKLKQSKEYRQLFAEAYADYPNFSLSLWSISDALAHYVKSLTAHNSPFDQMARGEAPIDPTVAKGFSLFMGKGACGTCHFAPTFSGLVPPYYRESESEVLGVPAEAVWEDAEIDPDLGRLVSSRPQDEAYFHAYAFKTPTVRNAELTGPYMHNGVYKTLEEVMDFYNRGGGAGIGSYVEHQTLPPDPLGLEEDEITSIITFMESLTDTIGLTTIPTQLPKFEDHPEWDNRPIGGAY